MTAPAGAFPLLLSPAELKPGLGLRNRVVFQPHFTALGAQDGIPSDDHAAYHAERARGGVGLIVFESQAVHPTGKMNGHFVHAWDPAVVEAYETVTTGVHAHGTRIISQLTHGGPTTALRPPEVLWAPSQYVDPSDIWSTKAMDGEDIRAVVAGFATAAANARAGGFDGVEVKVAHDGLLRCFTSPQFNRRADAYGGSFENRMRLPLEVLRAVRAAIGPELALGVRLCLSEYTAGGYELDYGLRVAEALEASGVLDYFNSDHGSYASTWYEIPPFAVPEGAFRELSRALKANTDLCVISSGRVRRPELAEEILASGDGDLVGMARQLIADPYLVERLRAGRADEVRLCIACNDACVIQTAQGKPIRCVVNPSAGRERSWSDRRLERAAEPLAVVVVGGGAAGLKAAETAALRGHAVTVLDRADRLGGQILLAARQPLHAEILDSVLHLERRARRLGVDVRLGVEADADAVLALDPAVVVVATGSEPDLPPRDGRGADDAARHARSLGLHIGLALEGLDLPHVWSSDECYGEDAPSSGRVVVLDGTGQWEAIGTAELLATRGCSVEVLSPRALVGSNCDTGGRVLWHQRAIERGIIVSPNVAPLAVVADGVAVRDLLSGRERVVEADAVVPVFSRRSREDLWLRLREAASPDVELVRIGDCVAPRLLQHAIADGYAVGRSIGAGRAVAAARVTMEPA